MEAITKARRPRGVGVNLKAFPKSKDPSRDLAGVLFFFFALTLKFAVEALFEGLLSLLLLRVGSVSQDWT